MNYKLKKDSPTHEAGTVFVPCENNDWYREENTQGGYCYLRKHIQNTEWFEPIPERIELEFLPEPKLGIDVTINSRVVTTDRRNLTLTQLELMEKALNGDIWKIFCQGFFIQLNLSFNFHTWCQGQYWMVFGTAYKLYLLISDQSLYT